jgi:flagellar protein FlaG
MSTSISLQTVSANSPVTALPVKAEAFDRAVSQNTPSVSFTKKTQDVAGSAGGNMLPQSGTKTGTLVDQKGIAEARELSQEDVSKAIQNLNDYTQNTQRQLHFNVDEETGRTIIKVVDTETDEVIRQIPSEEIMVLARNVHKASEEKGTLFELHV